MATKKWTDSAADDAFGTSGNFNPSGVPATGDTLIMDQDAQGPIAGSDQSAIVLANLLIYASNTQNVGDNGTPLKIGATSWRFGDASGTATTPTFPGRLNLDFDTNQFAGEVFDGDATRAGTDAGKENIRIKGTHASNKLTVRGGRVGVATDNVGDTATLSEIIVTGGICNVSSGVTLTKFQQDGGTAMLGCGATTVQQNGGALTVTGSGNITTMNVLGSTTILSTGTITSLYVFGSGNVTILTACTITTLYTYKGATVTLDPSITTITNAIQVPDGSYSDVKFKTPTGISLVVVKL